MKLTRAKFIEYLENLTPTIQFCNEGYCPISQCYDDLDIGWIGIHSTQHREADSKEAYTLLPQNEDDWKKNPQWATSFVIQVDAIPGSWGNLIAKDCLELLK